MASYNFAKIETPESLAKDFRAPLQSFAKDSGNPSELDFGLYFPNPPQQPHSTQLQSKFARMKVHSTRLLGKALLLLFWASTLSRGAEVTFDHTDYLGSPGVPIEVRVHLDNPIPEGLFSYGIKLLHDPDATVNSVVVDPELDFNGVAGPGAFIEIGLGMAGVKGTIDVLSGGLVPYAGVNLATFNLTYQTPGDHSLSLDFFRTLGSTETLFVDGNGMGLDATIMFGAASVQVVPEPSPWAMISGGAVFLAFLRKRRI